jgi:hypothetical protein
MQPKIVSNRLSMVVMITLGILAIIIGIATWKFDKPLGIGIAGMATLYLIKRWINEFDLKKRFDYKFTFPQDLRLLGSLFLGFIVVSYAALQITDMIVWILGLIRK